MATRRFTQYVGCTYIEQLYKKLVKFIGIFYKLRNKLPPAVLKIIYFTFVYSHILYGVEIYANTHMSYLDKLIKLNNIRY
jgi:hypothetical protein